MNEINAMSLKARIRNIAKANNISAQVVLQNYFFERFLDRLSKSAYCENFILKGGLLIAAMTGIETRSTMDMDATIRSFPFEEQQIVNAINEICSLSADDNIVFKITGVNFIRENSEYGGFRISLDAAYDKIVSPLSIDVTSGDIITPKPVKRTFKSIFDNSKKFEIWTYNSETILAEKIETILRRSESSTRPRDLYDVYLILKTQKINKGIFQKALISTSEYRGSIEAINNSYEIIDNLFNSKLMKQQWEKYCKEYSYAKDIAYEETLEKLLELLKSISNF